MPKKAKAPSKDDVICEKAMKKLTEVLVCISKYE